MAVTQYVGPKIVPHGFTNWNATTAYDGLYCAYYGYQWYIACNGPVPVGVSPVDREYWAPYSLNSGDIQNITAKVNQLFPTTELTAGTDLNSIIQPGNYCLGGTDYDNIPEYYNGTLPGACSLEVKQRGGTNATLITQEITDANSRVLIWIRNLYGTGDWTPWYQSSANPMFPTTFIPNNSDLDDITDVGTYFLAGSYHYDNFPPINLPGNSTIEVFMRQPDGENAGLFQRVMVPQSYRVNTFERYYGNIDGTIKWGEWSQTDSYGLIFDNASPQSIPQNGIGYLGNFNAFINGNATLNTYETISQNNRQLSLARRVSGNLPYYSILVGNNLNLPSAYAGTFIKRYENYRGVGETAPLDFYITEQNFFVIFVTEASTGIGIFEIGFCQIGYAFDIRYDKIFSTASENTTVSINNERDTTTTTEPLNHVTVDMRYNNNPAQYLLVYLFAL